MQDGCCSLKRSCDMTASCSTYRLPCRPPSKLLYHAIIAQGEQTKSHGVLTVLMHRGVKRCSAPPMWTSAGSGLQRFPQAGCPQP